MDRNPTSSRDASDKFVHEPVVVATNGVNTLSEHLRAETACLHIDAELCLRLPGSVRDRQDYCQLLKRFLGLYEPLERSIEQFDQWERLGFTPRSRQHSTSLTSDLIALEADLQMVRFAHKTVVPKLPTFAHALGALYVVEGSRLGGQVILRGLDEKVAHQIVGATRFMSGRSDKTESTWASFKAALDTFGRSRPRDRADVLVGAERTFRAVTTWFTSRDGAVNR